MREVTEEAHVPKQSPKHAPPAPPSTERPPPPEEPPTTWPLRETREEIPGRQAENSKRHQWKRQEEEIAYNYKGWSERGRERDGISGKKI